MTTKPRVFQAKCPFASPVYCAGDVASCCIGEGTFVPRKMAIGFDVKVNGIATVDESGDIPSPYARYVQSALMDAISNITVYAADGHVLYCTEDVNLQLSIDDVKAFHTRLCVTKDQYQARVWVPLHILCDFFDHDKSVTYQRMTIGITFSPRLYVHYISVPFVVSDPYVLVHRIGQTRKRAMLTDTHSSTTSTSPSKKTNRDVN